MEAKEIKSLLKQAREAIKEKEFKTALKHCKTVLNADKNNYNAWVFIGVSAQEMEQYSQAEEAFQRAIKISPDEILAWQGLSNFYEKQDKKEKLCDCLIKLVKLLDKDKAKQFETFNKLEEFSVHIRNTEKVIEIIELKLKLSESSESDQYEIWKEIFMKLCKVDNLGPKMEEMKASALKNIVSNSGFGVEDCRKFIIPYIGRLSKGGSTHEILQVVEFIQNEACKQTCLEFLLKSSLETFMNRERKPTDFLEQLVKLSEGLEGIKYLCACASGVLYVNQKKYSFALQLFQEALKCNPDCLEALYFLCETQLLLHLNMEAEKTAAKGLRVATKLQASADIVGSLYLFLGEALSGTKNWEAAFKAFEKCIEHSGRTPMVLKSFICALLDIGHVEKGQKIYAELSLHIEDKATILQIEGHIHMLKEEYPVALKKLRESVSLEESAFTLHLIGQILWKMKEHDKSSKIIAKAAEMDPYFSKNFLYLGHYYMDVLKHERAAQKFYKKAFDLDPTDEEAGMCLNSVLKALGEQEENIALLKRVTEQAPLGSCKWGWTQLGLLQLERGSASDAIFSFQNAIRAAPCSSYIWECLGDAYIKRGSYESALKAYEKASELNPDAMYPLYQVSMIQKARELYEDAITRFKNLLKLEASYVPGLIGLAESLLLLAKKLFSECLYGRSRECLQEMLDLLSRVVSTNASLTCLWKLAGDACTFYYHFGPDHKLLEVPSNLCSEHSTPNTKEELLQAGARFYGYALSLNNSLSSLWHDLGISLYYQSVLSASKEILAQKAFLCLQKAVSIAPSNTGHWLALGTIAVISEVHDYAIAQHAFIKAIEIENNNVEAWTNLGILYLQNDDVYLAHSAFKVAQSLDPSYPMCWIGQAIIASREKHSETLDLFRHSTTLGSHAEAFLGYGQALCGALFDSSTRGTTFYKYNIEQMDAVTVAADCLIKYTDNIRGCAEAFNTLGILLERQKLYRTALLSYQRALNLCNHPDSIEKYRTNYARLLSLTENYDAAIAEYMKLKAVSIPLLCSFAFTLYKKGEYGNAYSVLERALKVTEVAGCKSHILVAMAMVKWSQQNKEKSSDELKEISDIQNLLLQSCQMQPPSVFGLLALWALAIKNNQIAVTVALKKKLLPFKNGKEFYSSIALLSATQAFVNKGHHSAFVELQHAVHNHPGAHEIWIQASYCMLQWNSCYVNLVDVFSKVAVFHGCDKEQASQILALSRISAGYKKASLVAAQKAVHIHPDKLANWLTLAAACHVSDADRNIIGWIFGFVKSLAKAGVKTDVLGWIVCTEVYHNLCRGAVVPASKLLQKALGVGSFSPDVQSSLEVLKAFLESSGGRIDPLVLTMKSNSGNFLAWQILVKLLIQQEKYADAVKTLEKFVIASTRSFPELKIYPLLQLAALSYKAMSVLEDKEKWIKIGEEALTEAVKISSNNQAARFIQALFAIEKGNTSLARRSLEKVVFNSVIYESKWMESVAVSLLIPIYAAKKDKEALQRLAEKFPSSEDLKSALSAVSETGNL